MGLFLFLLGFYFAGAVCLLASLNIIFHIKFGLRRDAFIDSLKLSLYSWTGIYGLLTGKIELKDKNRSSNE